MNSSSKIYIGTSGFAYSHWREVFYPEELADTSRLRYYAARFNSVEINSTFYRTPSPQNFIKWYETTPANFSFILKGSKFVTHYHKLNVGTAYLNRFLGPAQNLKDKLRAILWQLPPELTPTSADLEEFLRNLSAFKKIQHIFEFRNQAWYTPETDRLLSHYNAVRCCSDWPGLPFEINEVSLPVQYFRLHGPENAVYCGSYTEDFLHSLAHKIISNSKKHISSYVYFNNDIAGHAVKNALKLMRNLG
ncbi:DUF72 domain-containing protein [Lentisphaerota bacterium ZTH]|nr:DUF72 domain-containing protein [Lentisphaerota bacterium]WET05473.1 DUF72 domain-containing protein [Lentisphaerota bacterium ZTH]